MIRDITRYFNEIVNPLLEERHPAVAREMSIQIRGSYGLGIADADSDLDAILWLDDSVWKAEGRQVQLTLAHHVPPVIEHPSAIACDHGHPEVSVWPLSWLAERRRFLEEAVPEDVWELVTIEELFEIQQNLVLRDPQGIFRRLREATAPEHCPATIWTKWLLQQLKQLDDDITTYGQVVHRGRTFEAIIMNGRLVEILLRLGFLLSRQYYPWPTHLHWAFAKLPATIQEVSPYLDILASTGDQSTKLSAAQRVRAIYSALTLQQDLLTAEMLENLIWAERLEAWSNKNWHEWIATCEQKAEAAGYDTKDFWMWSLWK